MTLGVVVIGRNEGERLVRCLRSVVTQVAAVVYADSGSTDGSPERARQLGADVITLDDSAPHTAARGRNAGFARLVERHPEIDVVQVIDGDCEVQPGWLETAAAYLEAHPEVAVVCGRRRERFPDATPWNLLIDVEWDTPVGEATACGGDAMIRVGAWRRAGGYDPSLIAGEDPEFCWRIRRDGGRIVRLAHEMTLHDAALERAGQWWRRQVRSGHAYAETVWRHRDRPDPERLRRLASLLFWGAAWPVACVLAALFTNGLGLVGLLAYARPALYCYRDVRRRWPARAAALSAASCIAAKFAELQGALTFAWNQFVRGRAGRLIEYKGPSG